MYLSPDDKPQSDDGISFNALQAGGNDKYVGPSVVDLIALKKANPNMSWDELMEKASKVGNTLQNLGSWQNFSNAAQLPAYSQNLDGSLAPGDFTRLSASQENFYTRPDGTPKFSINDPAARAAYMNASRPPADYKPNIYLPQQQWWDK